MAKKKLNKTQRKEQFKMKNDEYIQTCFENIATIMKAVGIRITMMGVMMMMNGYENDDEAKRQGMQQILKGSSMEAFPVFSNPADYEWYLKENSDNEIKNRIITLGWMAVCCPSFSIKWSQKIRVFMYYRLRHSRSFLFSFLSDRLF